MKNHMIIKCIGMLLFLFAINTNISAQSEQLMEGVLRIKLNETKAEFVRNSKMTKSAKGYSKIGDKKLDVAMESCKATDMKRVFRTAGAFENKHRKHGLHLWYEVTFDKTVKVTEAIAAFKGISDVLISEPLYEKRNIGGEGIKMEEASLITPTNDFFYDYQWHYDNTGVNLGIGEGGTVDADIDLPEAWAIQTGSPDVIVAVIDGGIDVSHEDLIANIWINSGEIPNNNRDDDGNGYVDDINGYGFGDRTSTINASDHGTHVGGTVAAVSNNEIGVAGVAGGNGFGDGVRLMSCSVFGDRRNAGFDESFIYAADMGAVIAQNSWGYTTPGFYEQSVLDAIDYFIEEAGYDANGNPTGPMQGGLVIFAAGNDGVDADYYPGYYDRVMAVGSTDLNDEASDFSNRGDWVDIAAPGSDIASTYPANGYGYNSGTSMACPHVSGVAALIVSEYAGNITPEEVWSRLVDNADPLPFDYLGSGRLNAFQALNAPSADEEVVFPDPTKKYYIDSAHFNYRIAATGESEAPYTTPETTTGEDVEWVFVDKGNGFWHIQRAAGGSLPRLRTDNTEFADMQATSSDGVWTYYELTEGYYEYSYFVTLPDGPASHKRLQINSSGTVRMVPETSALTWESFNFTEVGASTTSSEETPEIITAELEMAVYPSPAVDFISVTNTENTSYNMLEIQDMTGNVETIDTIIDSSNIKIDVSGLPDGIHFLRLSGTDGSVDVLRFAK